MIDSSEKLAGLLIPVFALRRSGDLGIGDTEAVKEAIHFCAAHKFAVLQLLPINETGGDNSPYNAISSVALDPVLLSLNADIDCLLPDAGWPTAVRSEPQRQKCKQELELHRQQAAAAQSV